MRQYYIFLENEQIGPLSFDELSSKQISKDTKVWFEGIEDWKNAGEIEELKKILISIPPPINSLISKPLPPRVVNEINYSKVEEDEQEEETSKILGFNKNTFFKNDEIDNRLLFERKRIMNYIISTDFFKAYNSKALVDYCLTYEEDIV